MEKILDTKIPFKFDTFILGNVSFHSGHFSKYLFGILITACKKTITKHWLLPDPPKIEDWADAVNEIYIMEKITFSL